MIHPTAIIDAAAKIADDVKIGPYSIIEGDVEIGAGTRIDGHVVIKGPTTIGCNNHIHQFASLGDIPQDLKFDETDHTRLIIGDGNSIREYVSVHRAIVFDKDNAEANVTRIGNNNMLMAHAHVGHNCILGNNIVIVNSTNLAGHVEIDDYAILSGFTGVHQFCRIGAHSMIGIQSRITQDIPPFVMFAEGAAKTINAIGLKRRGFSQDEVNNIRNAFKTIYRQGLAKASMLKALEAQAQASPAVDNMYQFIKGSPRGIAR